MQIADRVLAFSRGRIVAELPRNELSVEALTRAVGGIAAPPQPRPRRGPPMTAGHDIGVKAVPPDKADEKLRPTAAARLRTTILHVLSVHGLFVFGILLVIIFSILLPSTFTGTQTFRAILGNNTTVALLAMAEMIVIATGNYDLSIAYNVGLMHITAMGLLTDANVPWPLVVVLTVAVGGLVGWVNGLLVEYARVRLVHRHYGNNTTVALLAHGRDAGDRHRQLRPLDRLQCRPHAHHWRWGSSPTPMCPGRWSWC